MEFLKKNWYFFLGGLILIGLAYYYFVVDKAKKEAEKKEAETLGTAENPLTLDKQPPVPPAKQVEGIENVWKTPEQWENAVNRYYAILIKEAKIPTTTAEKEGILGFLAINKQLNELNGRAAWVALRRFNMSDTRFPMMDKTNDNAQKLYEFFTVRQINLFV